MDGKRLIEKIRLRNILSFGDKGEEVTLEPLNIIIGQNASGKSNLVDVIKLLRFLPQNEDLENFFSQHGGLSEWVWKGQKINNNLLLGIIFRNTSVANLTNYEIEFHDHEYLGLEILNEKIKLSETEDTFLREQIISESGLDKEVGLGEPIIGKYFNLEINDTKFNPLFIASNIKKIKVYSDLQTNRKSEIRKPQFPNASNNFLEEDGSNLSLVLNDLQYKGKPKDKILDNLKKFYPRIEDFIIRNLGEYIQLYLREASLEKPISATRLSDGTLRYLCLLAILCHPEPPPLICIEEPETGLHPDILPTIAELMIEASQRTQLIVTTHSDILVSAFSKIPEAILVCEKDEDGTHFKRLNEEELKIWMEEYNDLGEIWLRGGIGGTRW